MYDVVDGFQDSTLCIMASLQPIEQMYNPSGTFEVSA